MKKLYKQTNDDFSQLSEFQELKFVFHIIIDYFSKIMNYNLSEIVAMTLLPNSLYLNI